MTKYIVGVFLVTIKILKIITAILPITPMIIPKDINTLIETKKAGVQDDIK